MNNLISYGLISYRPTEIGQGHHLFLNEESIIIRVLHEIEDFEGTYLPLLTNAVGIILSLIKNNQKAAASELLNSIISLNTHFLGLYLVSGIFIWPKEIRDKDSVDRLYSIVFNRIKK